MAYKRCAVRKHRFQVAKGMLMHNKQGVAGGRLGENLLPNFLVKHVPCKLDWIYRGCLSDVARVLKSIQLMTASMLGFQNYAYMHKCH